MVTYGDMAKTSKSPDNVNMLRLRRPKRHYIFILLFERIGK
jgi:hypothetical protein